MNNIVRFIETIVFGSRFLIVPFLLGLIVGLAVLIFKFGVKLYEFVLHIGAGESTEAIVGLLGLVDLTLTANLLVIVICSSYENFVAPTNYAEHPSWPPGLVRIGFTGLKQKLWVASSPSPHSSGSLTSTAMPTAPAWVVGIPAGVRGRHTEGH